MDFDLSIDNENSKDTELDFLEKKYKKMGFKEFDTWDKDFEEQKEIYRECLKQKKSFEEIHGKDEYNSNCLY